MKERGLILPMGDGCDLMLLPYWRCLFGHRWLYSVNGRIRQCSRCNKRMSYELRDFGRTKCWCWIPPSPEL